MQVYWRLVNGYFRICSTNGQQTTEGFHGLRRTTEGLLYYTKVDKDSTDSIDFDGGNPTDKNGNDNCLKVDYTDEEQNYNLVHNILQVMVLTTTFTLTTPVLDGTRISCICKWCKDSN